MTTTRRVKKMSMTMMMTMMECAEGRGYVVVGVVVAPKLMMTKMMMGV